MPPSSSLQKPPVSNAKIELLASKSWLCSQRSGPCDWQTQVSSSARMVTCIVAQGRHCTDACSKSGANFVAGTRCVRVGEDACRELDRYNAWGEAALVIFAEEHNNWAHKCSRFTLMCLQYYCAEIGESPPPIMTLPKKYGANFSTMLSMESPKKYSFEAGRLHMFK